MRCLPALAAALGILLSGCVSVQVETSTTDGPTTEAGPRTLPAPIRDSKSVSAAFSGGNVGDPAAVCEPEQTAQCFRYPFTANNTVAVTARLAWTVPGNDFDLYLMQGDTVVSNDGINTLPPAGPGELTATNQVLNAEVEAGSYELLVVAWFTGQDTYTLEATFS
jgi:hypothetical protein